MFKSLILCILAKLDRKQYLHVILQTQWMTNLSKHVIFIIIIIIPSPVSNELSENLWESKQTKKDIFL